jgi:hypothetical protein
VAKLIYIGTNDANEKGMSSKAYTIRLKETRVVIKYGSVQAIGGGGGKLYWLDIGPRQFTTQPLRTTKRALAYIDEKVKSKENKGYEKLPGKVKIYLQN